MTPALEVRDVTVRFGGVVALEAVSFAVGVGELVGMIGPNGAGKTTLIDTVTGFVPYEGSVSLSGLRIDGAPAHRRSMRGLGRTFQSLELFEELTARENVSVGTRTSPGVVAAALDAVGIAPAKADVVAAKLSSSERRFVSLARALAGDPKVLLLDEVAAGLDTDERAVLVERLRQIARGGCGVVLVDHDVGLVCDIANRIIVIDHGQVIANGPPAQVRSNERVLAAYLGRRT